jgi:hypothetical protein
MANDHIPRPDAQFHARRNDFVTYVSGHPTERVPNDPRDQLWRRFMRAVEDAAPKAFVA